LCMTIGQSAGLSTLRAQGASILMLLGLIVVSRLILGPLLRSAPKSA